MTLEEAIAPDLPLETFEEVYRRLLRALRRKKGFGLFFVLQSDYAQGNKIIEGIRQDLPQKKIAVLQIDRKTKTLYDKIAELKEQEPFDILFIRGFIFLSGYIFQLISSILKIGFTAFRRISSSTKISGVSVSKHL